MKRFTPISDFDYHLPQEQIAQRSVEPHDHARLLVLDKQTGERSHKIFYEIVDELQEGDVLVMNQTKVFKARLEGVTQGKKIEVFLLRANKDGSWQALVRPGKRVAEGDTIDLEGITMTVREKRHDGVVVLETDLAPEEVIAHANKVGEVPIPPYVEKTKEALENYQTIYAKEIGSVAAPTAGFHFTEALLEKIQAKGVQIEFVTLHVGIGTFRPIKTETIEEHQMHAEFVEIDARVAARINKAKKKERRVIAVGTTSTRALEGVAIVSGGMLPETGFVGDVNLFISPGFEFKIIDALITNFHLPKSSLLVLVSALAGRKSILDIYKEAVLQGYRFFSFGDAMFIR
jgi:S-adenosylmethionine:tRNA ribosyltransferase-isomerase